MNVENLDPTRPAGQVRRSWPRSSSTTSAARTSWPSRRSRTTTAPRRRRRPTRRRPTTRVHRDDRRPPAGRTYEFRQIDPDDGTGRRRAARQHPRRLPLPHGPRRSSSSTGRARRATTPNSVVATRKGAALKYSPGRIDPTNPAFNSSRKPLAAEFLWKGRTVFAIANHFNSKGGDDPLFGRFQPPVRVLDGPAPQAGGRCVGRVRRGHPRGRPARRDRGDGRLQRLPVLGDARDPGGRGARQPDGDAAGRTSSTPTCSTATRRCSTRSWSRRSC